MLRGRADTPNRLCLPAVAQILIQSEMKAPDARLLIVAEGNAFAGRFELKATRKGITLGNYQEARIRRFHLTLDEYLGNSRQT